MSDKSECSSRGYSHEPQAFQVVNALTSIENCKPIVESYWKEMEPIFMSTSTLLRFTKKLKALNRLYSTWQKIRWETWSGRQKKLMKIYVKSKNIISLIPLLWPWKKKMRRIIDWTGWWSLKRNISTKNPNYISLIWVIKKKQDFPPRNHGKRSPELSSGLTTTLVWAVLWIQLGIER